MALTITLRCTWMKSVDSMRAISSRRLIRTSASPDAVTTLTYFSVASKHTTSDTGIMRTVLPTPARMTLMRSAVSGGGWFGKAMACMRCISAARSPGAGGVVRAARRAWRRATVCCSRSAVAGLSR